MTVQPKVPLLVGQGQKSRQVLQVGFCDVRCACGNLLCKATRPSVLCIVCLKCGNLNVVDVSGLTNAPS